MALAKKFKLQAVLKLRLAKEEHEKQVLSLIVNKINDLVIEVEEIKKDMKDFKSDFVQELAIGVEKNNLSSFVDFINQRNGKINQLEKDLVQEQYKYRDQLYKLQAAINEKDIILKLKERHDIQLKSERRKRQEMELHELLSTTYLPKSEE